MKTHTYAAHHIPHIERCHCSAHTLHVSSTLKTLNAYTLHIYIEAVSAVRSYTFIWSYNRKMCATYVKGVSQNHLSTKSLRKLSYACGNGEIVRNGNENEISNFENQPNIDRDRHESIHSTAFNRRLMESMKWHSSVLAFTCALNSRDSTRWQTQHIQFTNYCSTATIKRKNEEIIEREREKEIK